MLAVMIKYLLCDEVLFTFLQYQLYLSISIKDYIYCNRLQSMISFISQNDFQQQPQHVLS